MAIKTLEEMLNQVNELMPDNSSDEYLNLVEDITDTYNNLNNNEYNKAKYDELDASWRKRYKERFLSGKPIEDEPSDDDEKPKKYTFESLFKEE